MAKSLRRVARALAGRRRPRSHAIDASVMEAGRWMQDIRQEQYGHEGGGEVVRAMVIVELRVKPDDPGTAVVFATDRSQGYYSQVEAAGLLHQGLKALDFSPTARLLQDGMNQLAGGLHARIREDMDRDAADDPSEGFGVERES